MPAQSSGRNERGIFLIVNNIYRSSHFKLALKVKFIRDFFLRKPRWVYSRAAGVQGGEQLIGNDEEGVHA